MSCSDLEAEVEAEAGFDGMYVGTQIDPTDIEALVTRAAAELAQPMVIDADGLTAKIQGGGKVRVMTESYQLDEIGKAYERVEKRRVRFRAVVVMEGR